MADADEIRPGHNRDGCDTYALGLTFRDWLRISMALSYKEDYYRLTGLDGEANRLLAIRTEIIEALRDE